MIPLYNSWPTHIFEYSSHNHPTLILRFMKYLSANNLSIVMDNDGSLVSKLNICTHNYGPKTGTMIIADN